MPPFPAVLSSYIEGPKTWHLAVRVANHIAQALDFTRQHRLLHGNVTPKNILIRNKDQAALLNDLKLNRALKGSRLLQNVIDQKRNAERYYLAPEVLAGDKAYVDFLCDIYSLGAIVYHLSTGQPLFRSQSLENAMEQIKVGTPTRPRKIQRTIPREFEMLIMRMIAKHQEDRYQSPADLLSDLAPIIKAHGIKV